MCTLFITCIQFVFISHLLSFFGKIKVAHQNLRICKKLFLLKGLFTMTEELLQTAGLLSAANELRVSGQRTTVESVRSDCTLCCSATTKVELIHLVRSMDSNS